MAYVSTSLRKDLKIDSIISIHYFEYRSDFSFEGESHDFWEFCCVDKGEVEVYAEKIPFTLHKGQIIFHKPNGFHKLNANGKSAPNLVVMAFQTSSPCMDFFRNKILDINETERNLLAQIIIEARRCFCTPLDDPYLQKLGRREPSPFASEQLISLYLEQMLLQMCRRYQEVQPSIPLEKSTKRTNDSEIYERIVTYLENNICNHVTIEEICHANLIGRSKLQKLFRDRNGCGVIYFFSKMKIDMAKQLIREHHLNFTQISEHLGYTSIHYFSRQFKKITGMNPSEYALSIKILSEGKFSDD